MTKNEYVTDSKSERRSLRRRLKISIILLLLISVLGVAATFAWLALSTRPTVEAVSTTVSSNGALEIALLSTDTYEDPSQIKTGIGSSLDMPNMEEANLLWGNLVDLSGDVYGLQKIELYPTMLDATRRSGITSIGNSILKLPKFGEDGRVSALDSNSVSGTFAGETFTVNTSRQSYGVRAVGTANDLTPQQKALMTAKSSLISSINIARQSAKEALLNNGTALFDIIIRNSSIEITDGEINSLIDLTCDLETVLDNIQFSLRQGVIAIASSEVADEEQFIQTYGTLSNYETPLSRAIATLPFTFSGSTAITGWANEIESMKRTAASARGSLETLLGTSDTEEQLASVIEFFADTKKIYIGEVEFENDPTFSIGTAITVMPESGILSHIANYVGNYSANTTGWTGEREQFDHEIAVRTGNETGNLDLLSGIVNDLSAASGTVDTSEIKDICGYVVDLAFRSNADNASLLLSAEGQTNKTAENETDRGLGSFMSFTSNNLSEEAIVKIMNAIRVTFVDSRGEVLSMAKLNVSNYSNDDGTLSAKLYNYDYTPAGNSIEMGERNDDLSKIVDLPKNTPVIVSAIVWLDGDAIDNSLTAISGTTVEAKLNLQFATNTELIPVQN
ncbi:MAG: hypothetical protein IKN38_05455 [Clostridia bacterium]|nr:hypothetical protein [Clostridia bacterium]